MRTRLINSFSFGCLVSHEQERGREREFFVLLHVLAAAKPHAFPWRANPNIIQVTESFFIELCWVFLKLVRCHLELCIRLPLLVYCEDTGELQMIWLSKYSSVVMAETVIVFGYVLHLKENYCWMNFNCWREFFSSLERTLAVL